MEIELAVKTLRSDESPEWLKNHERENVATSSTWEDLISFLNEEIRDYNLHKSASSCARRAFARLVDDGEVQSDEWARFFQKKLAARKGVPRITSTLALAPYGFYVELDWDDRMEIFGDFITEELDVEDHYAIEMRLYLARALLINPEGLSKGYIDSVGLANLSLSARGTGLFGTEVVGVVGRNGQLGWSDFDIHTGMPVEGSQCKYGTIQIVTDSGEVPIFEYLKKEGMKLVCERCGSLLPSDNHLKCYRNWQVRRRS